MSTCKSFSVQLRHLAKHPALSDVQTPKSSIDFRVALVLFCLSLVHLHSQGTLVSSETVVGGRASAMGRAYCGLANDASAFAYNPSGLILEKSMVLSGQYSSLHGSLGTPLANQTWGGLHYAVDQWAVSANWVRFQSADQLTTPAIATDDLTAAERAIVASKANVFSPAYEDALSISIARQNIVKIDWGWNQYILPVEIPLGVTARYTHAALNGLGGKALSLDAAMMIRINLRDMFFSDEYPYLSFGWNWKNIGAAAMHWKSGRVDGYDSHTVVGFALIQPLESLESQVSIDYDHDNLGSAQERIGVEWRYRKYYNLRAGFYGSSFCCGVGADLRFFIVDYSFQASSNSILGLNHQLSLAFRLERLFL